MLPPLTGGTGVARVEEGVDCRDFVVLEACFHWFEWEDYFAVECWCLGYGCVATAAAAVIVVVVCGGTV